MIVNCQKFDEETANGNQNGYRIEKGIEAMFFGIAELKESQKKTDEQLNRIPQVLQSPDQDCFSSIHDSL
jgi:hypothetical protein